jgi:hypothetical protein
VADALADAFRAELPCDATVAAALAARARERLPRMAGSPDDTDEDLVLRLRDPRVFGAFVEALLTEPDLPGSVRRALVEHVFDLLPLPRTEGEVIEVQSRAPPHLLTLATVLTEADGLTVLHIMHLVYAVFLDRSLVTGVPRRVRSALVHSVLAESEAEEGLRALYAALDLSAVPESEAASELRRLLGDVTVPATLRQLVASLAAADDGGRSELTRWAQKQGLLPADLEDPQSPEVLANIPRLPGRLADTGRRYLERTGQA